VVKAEDGFWHGMVPFCGCWRCFREFSRSFYTIRFDIEGKDSLNVDVR